MHSSRLSKLGPSLLLATGATVITAAVVFATGSLVLPDQGLHPWQEGAPTAPTIEDLTGSQALLLVTGDDEGRFELNQLNVGEWNEDSSPDKPLNLSLTFRGNNVYLLITASDITAGTPVTGDAASATIGVEGAGYFGNNGECTVTLEDLDYKVLEPKPAVRDGVPRGVPIPTYAGTVECKGIKELRTERHIDLVAAFRHQPED